ncbi:mechanosensitive ion channel family protein [candidate division KSB1 bacterium]|nr:mechanosensitive ion channel [candidate division KSB1 bacterium]RQW00297.1 MAG: mechanosensitive ion channel family protein [candidate division KSB1 bacterium]
MKSVINWIKDSIILDSGLDAKFISSVITVLILVFISRILMFILTRGKDVRIQYNIRKTVAYTAFVFGFFIIGRIWFQGLQSLSTYLGLLSAGLAIALQVPIVNLAGWAFILWRKPFSVGDRVQIGEHRGDVIDQRIFMFTLMEIGNWVDADQSTGRVVHIPNGKVFTEMLANYSRGFQYLWHEIPVLITFESNWHKAKEILLSIAQQHAEALSGAAERRVRQAAKKFMIFYSKLTPTVYTTVRDCGVLLTIRLLCEPRARRGTEQAIWEHILEEFAKHDDIDFAYPTQRFFNNVVEGKPAARA